MAKNSRNLGGTLGAMAPSGPLAQHLAVKFSFEPDIVARILQLAPASNEWLTQQRELTFDENFGSEQAFTMCALRFLRRNIARVSRAEQSEYLKALDLHLEALTRLLLSYSQFNHTAADPIKFLEELERRQGKPSRRRDQIIETLTDPLLALRSFTQFQLRTIGSEPKESAEVIRRRNDFPRLVLIADIAATYKRVTGQEPTAYAADDNHLSPAVELVTVLAPVILKAARVKKTQVSAQTARDEIAIIKKLWSEGARPEEAGVLSAWANLG